MRVLPRVALTEIAGGGHALGNTAYPQAGQALLQDVQTKLEL